MPRIAHAVTSLNALPVASNVQRAMTLERINSLIERLPEKGNVLQPHDPCSAGPAP